ncbi:MAG: hypothetical protein IJA89_08060 [Clostridia bacterium]|nr:hypothetical protein [Clostridia bacterium]
MEKKSWITALALVSLFGFSLGAISCAAPDETTDKETQEIEISGFKIAETLTVQAGATVELQQPFVTDSTGKLLDCWTYVTDGDGYYVESSSGSFTAANVGTYTITYVVRDSENNVHEKKTVITVTDGGNVGDGVDGENAVVTLKANFEQFVAVNEQIEIDAVCSDETATLIYTVTSADDEPVNLDGNAFTLTETGAYKVKIAVENSDVSYSYDVFAEEPFQTGEVEAFNGAWEEKEAFVGGKRQDWEIVSSEESGVYDRFGREVTMAKYSTNRAYIPLFINIRESREYYQELAKEGYTHVSMWIYLDSTKSHITISDRDANGGFYRREGPDLHPGQWTQFKLSLLDGKSSWTRSFTTCYNLYAEQNHFYLQVDNSYEYNPWGGGDTLNMYFTDIMAIKPVTITAAEVETNKTVGDTVTLNDLFSVEDCELAYSVTYRGETVALDSDSYTFTGNGEYVITAYPTMGNYEGTATLTFNVSDNFVLSGSPVIKERADESVSVALSEFGAVAFSEVDGVTPTLSETQTVSYNGEAVALENGAFTATKDGAYDVEYKGTYDVDGVEYATYKTLTVDVWSAATKYNVIDVNNIKNISAYDWDTSSKKASCGEYTVGGRTGEFIKTTAGSQSLTFYAKPMYSKAYYQAMLAENPTMNVRMDYYFEVAAGKTNNVKSVFTSTTEKKTWSADYEYNWRSMSMTLESFIAQYDTIAERYETLKNAAYNPAGDKGGVGCWMHMVGSHVNRTLYMDLTLSFETTDATVALKDGAAVAVNTDNNLKELLDVKLDGETGEILTAEIYFNGAWTLLNDATFNPVWNSEYEFRFNVQTLDGLKATMVTTTLTAGDGSFEMVVDTNLHSVEKGGEFEVATLLTEDYDYEVEVLLYRGGEIAEIVRLTDGATAIDTATFAVGAYTVNVYALRGESDFAKILYYTFTLDVWTQETKLAVIDTESMRTIRAWDWDNSQTTASYGEYTVGGRTGEFIKTTAKGQSLVLYAKPMYSKAYYQALFAEHADMKLNIGVYLEVEKDDLTNNFMSVFTSTTGKTTWPASYEDNWLSFSMTLESFIAQYDDIANYYKAYAKASYGAGTSDSKGTWLHMIGSQVGRSMYLNVAMGVEATEATATLKENTAIDLDVDNDLNAKLDVKLDGEVGEIVGAEAYFNGAWVALSDCAFNPAWATAYEFRLNVQTVGGAKYKQITVSLTAGDGSFETVEDVDLHVVALGGSFDAATLLDGDYTYELNVFAKRGESKTAVSEVVNGTVISGANLTIGSYFVEVYATRGDEAFGRILYYTFTLDCMDDSTKLTWLETPTTDNKATLFKSYQFESNQYLTGTTVTSEVPAGNSGSFLKYQGVDTNRKEAMRITAKPLFSKAYYQSLVDSGSEYVVKFDVYIDNVYETSERTEINSYVWKANGTFASGTKLALKTWHYFTLPLETLVNDIDEKGEVDVFGVYIGSKTSDLVIFYVGNFRLEKAPVQWSAETLTTTMLTSYQYNSTQNLKDISLTSEIPDGGVAGTYVKYAQTVSKEDIQLAVAPIQDQAYYQALVADGTKWKITYDVYVETTNSACTQLATKLWTTSDETQSFKTSGTIATGAWHTVEVDLQYLIDNWGNNRLFGLNFLNQTNFDRSTDRATFYLGNIQLVEGEASGVATLKVSAEA